MDSGEQDILIFIQFEQHFRVKSDLNPPIVFRLFNISELVRKNPDSTIFIMELNTLILTNLIFHQFFF